MARASCCGPHCFWRRSGVLSWCDCIDHYQLPAATWTWQREGAEKFIGVTEIAVAGVTLVCRLGPKQVSDPGNIGGSVAVSKEPVVDVEGARPVSRRVFDATAFSTLLNELPHLIGRVEMETKMGATRNQLWALEADQILTPVIDIPKVKSPWRLSDGLELIAELQCKAIVVKMADAAWEGIQQAKVRSGLGVGVIINAIRDGKIQIGHRQEMFGYNGFCVLKSDIDQLKALTGELAENIPALPDGATTTAREFGRLVGMRDKGRFRALVAAGHSPASQMPNPKTGVMQLYMSDKDIEASHDRVMTSTTMSKEFGEHRNSIISILEAGGVKPFSPGGEDFGTVYLRQAINAALGSGPIKCLDAGLSS